MKGIIAIFFNKKKINVKKVALWGQGWGQWGGKFYSPGIGELKNGRGPQRTGSTGFLWHPHK